MPSKRRRPLATLAVAWLLALLPAGAPVALAADGLRLSVDASYRVDTADHAVHVRLDITATNTRPNTVRDTPTGSQTTRWYFDRLDFAIQGEARRVRARSGGSDLESDVERRDGYRALTVVMPDLFYGQTRRIRVDFDLPGGEPRSSSDIRVGRAFTTFTAWAWGDPARSTVRIVMPKGFDDDGYGRDLTRSESGARATLASGGIDDPSRWFHVVVADRPSALTADRVGTATEPLVVHAWPEDEAWRTRVSDVLSGGVPRLRELIGLPWPVTNELHVNEIHTPLLEGYAGFYDPTAQEITISEDLDDHTIVHEAAHAWFNRALIRDRWLNEGLAEEYAARVLADLGLETSGELRPPQLSQDSAGQFALVDWPAPQRIDDQETDALERYGYDASWHVVHEIAGLVGDEGMREVFAALDARTMAYRGDGPPEPSDNAPDWKRFLDLAQEAGVGSRVERLIRDFVVPVEESTALESRRQARDAYAALVRLGGSWAIPIGARRSMEDWSFTDATTLIAAGRRAIEAREALEATEDELGVRSPADQESPYEAAEDATAIASVATDLGSRAQVAIELVAAADALAAQRGPLAQVGLLGEEPGTGLEGGRLAYAAGDLHGARAGSATTLAILLGAEEIGRTRVLTGGAVGAVLVALIVLAVVVARRRRRRSGPSVVAGGSYATLAASPEPAPADQPRIEP